MAARRTMSLVCLALASGCATLPDDPVQSALYADLRQVVDTEQRTGWIIDQAEYEDAAPTVLQSVCQVSEEQRIKLLDWFDRRIDELGGPAERAYEREGKDLDAIDELLTLERMRGTLIHADEQASERCPFWLEADPEFSGVQTDTHKFILLGESFGGLSLIFRDGIQFGGGGAFRLFGGWGPTDRLTLALGVEVGGQGAVSGVGTDEEQELQARPTGALPLLIRLHDDTWVYDFEVAAITQYYQEALSLPPGVRAAFGIGIGSVRIGSFMPMAVGFIGYEFEPEFKDLPVSHAIRLGTRVGLNFDP
jgi:hypothetical protein